MKNPQNDKRRSFLKYVLAGTVAGTAAAANGRKAQGKHAATANHLQETLYHETEAFKNYYKSLRS